jgi:ATP-dependent DNA helicase PIF1
MHASCELNFSRINLFEMKRLINAISTPKLSKLQQQILDQMIKGKNVYFTGKAGSGKTLVLSSFISHCKSLKIPIAVTASTGLAASLLKGQTFHSFTSIPPKQSGLNIIDTLAKLKTVKKRYCQTQVLIIDEISMLDPDYFDLFNHCVKQLRQNRSPLGGLQVILVGDFFQLPPIDSSSSRPERVPVKANSKLLEFIQPAEKVDAWCDEIVDQRRFLFDSIAFKELLANGMQTFSLPESFRQSDPLFTSILDDIRMGVYSDALWPNLPTQNLTSDDIKPTFLSPFKGKAERYNQQQLHALQGDPLVFPAIDFVSRAEHATWNDVETGTVDHAFKAFQAGLVSTLKVGAQVILLRNVNVGQGLANGSRGVVVGFDKVVDLLLKTVLKLPVVRFANGVEYVVGYHEFTAEIGDAVVTRQQIPLQLGWGMTIHRAQGMSLDRVVVKMENAFVPGQAYVALSRARSLEGLSVVGMNQKSIWASSRVKQFYKAMDLL